MVVLCIFAAAAAGQPAPFTLLPSEQGVVVQGYYIAQGCYRVQGFNIVQLRLPDLDVL